MTFKDIALSVPKWLNVEGPESGIVISSRARIARNIEGVHYTHRIDNTNLKEVVDSVLEAAEAAGLDRKYFFSNDNLNDDEKSVFIERHLISPALASKTGNHGVLVMDDETSSIMINEEDHIRLQSLRPGFDLKGVKDDALLIEDKLSRNLSFSFSEDYGYLTACPTNMGKGLRVSVLIHLPALVLTKEINPVIRSSSQLGMAIRGYYGEGSDVVGNLFQISNQASLGKSESDILNDITAVVERLIDYEKRAADMLSKEATSQLDDKVWRSIGILKTARTLSTHEFMNLSSAVRLGMYLGYLEHPTIKLLNELMIITQPGHLQARIGAQLEPMERDIVRANIVRERFVDVKV